MNSEQSTGKDLDWGLDDLGFEMDGDDIDDGYGLRQFLLERIRFFECTFLEPGKRKFLNINKMTEQYRDQKSNNIHIR